MGLRLHIGNQSIYLRDYINVDVPHPGGGLAVDYPKRVERNITDESDYYRQKAHIDAAHIVREGPESNDGDVCDVYGSWQQLPFEDGTVDEILSRQCFEHLSRPETVAAMLEARRVLKAGGLLRLDVPDRDQTLEKLESAIRAHERELAVGGDSGNLKQFSDQIALQKRHLLGSRKNDWAVHMGSWSPDELIAFCKRFGFQVGTTEPNIHFYPAFMLTFVKGELPRDSEYRDYDHRKWDAAWQYAGNSPTTLGGPILAPHAESVCLEVGPGGNPWPLANVYVDISADRVAQMVLDGKQAYCRNIENLDIELPPSGKFDFVLASHVLEHTEDPAKACKELMRVAKAGCIVCPSPMKEGLFTAHETDHKWHVLRARHKLLFVRLPLIAIARPVPLYDHLWDSNVAAQQHRLWRYGDVRLEEIGHRMRDWWYKAEPFLDTIYHWKETIDYEIFD